MYNHDSILYYLCKIYNDDGNFSNTTFSYLGKLTMPKDSKESHAALTEFFLI